MLPAASAPITPPNKASLYQRLLDIGATLDHHESDLYVLITPEAAEVVRAYYADKGYGTPPAFTSQLDGKRWWDCPFQYLPFLTKKGV